MKRIMLLLCCLLSSFGLRAQLKVTLLPEASVDSLHIEGLSNTLKFFDYEHYLLIFNPISGRQYIYWKDKATFAEVPIDSVLVKSVYIDFLKAPQQYKDYKTVADKAPLKPKITSLCAYDDNTVLGCLETFRADTILDNDHVTVEYSPVLSILEISCGKTVKQYFVNDSLPLSYHGLESNVLSYKKTLYFTMLPELDPLLQNGQELKMLVQMKRTGRVYKADKVLPEAINDYLITNEVYYNYNRVYFDNGYSLMSLSNYIVNIETREKIFLPIADSVFRKVRINPQTMLINYIVSDFKYNNAEQRCYIKYAINNVSYVASFHLHARQFDTNELLYAFDSDFCKDLKNTCLSWDGKRVVYSMKGESCFHYVSVPELQRRVREYKRKTSQ